VRQAQAELRWCGWGRGCATEPLAAARAPPPDARPGSGRHGSRLRERLRAGSQCPAAGINASRGSTPAISGKSRSRCSSGIRAPIAYTAMRQSFADRGVTPAQRQRAYRWAAARAVALASGSVSRGNSPSTRSQRANRAASSAPWSTSCRIGGASHTGSPLCSAPTSVSTSAAASPRRKAIHTDESTSTQNSAARAGYLWIVPFCHAA
jgi:hypothetical protein